MATNAIPHSYSAVVSLAEDALDGATQQGTAVGLALNTAPKIRADLVAVRGDPEAQPPTPGRQAELGFARAAKTAATAGQRSVESNARAYVASAIGVLKNYLGNQWGSRWAAAGFTAGSLAVPDDPLPLLRELTAYFTRNASQENPKLNVSAGGADEQAVLIVGARSTANQAGLALAAAQQARATAFEALRTRLSGLRAELDQLLPPADPRWYAFGFDRPADGAQPAAVRGLVLTAAGPGTVLAGWDDARRADHYRVLRQVQGVDPEPLATVVHDPEATLTGLPSGRDVIVTVIAVNAAGDGPATASAPFRVP